MRVKLLNITPLDILVTAIRTCHKSEEKSDSSWETKPLIDDNYKLNTGKSWYILTKWKFILGENDKKLIKKIIKMGHTSTLEHIVFSWHIYGISRGCLQQLVRHRIASYSVASTRYALKKMLDKDITIENLKYFCVINGNEYELEKIVELLKVAKYWSEKAGNDKAKQFLPECLKTELVMTINARSLRNFFELRLDKKAHFEIRELAERMLVEIPEEYQILFEDIVKGRE